MQIKKAHSVVIKSLDEALHMTELISLSRALFEQKFRNAINRKTYMTTALRLISSGRVLLTLKAVYPV